MEDRRSRGQDGCAGHMSVRTIGGQDGQLSDGSCRRTRAMIGVLVGEWFGYIPLKYEDASTDDRSFLQRSEYKQAKHTTTKNVPI